MAKKRFVRILNAKNRSDLKGRLEPALQAHFLRSKNDKHVEDFDLACSDTHLSLGMHAVNYGMGGQLRLHTFRHANGKRDKVECACTRCLL